MSAHVGPSDCLDLVLLVELLRLFDDFFLIFVVALRRCIFLRLVAEVGRSNPHPPCRRGPTMSQIGVIEHLNRQVHALGSEVENQSIALEATVFVGV